MNKKKLEQLKNLLKASNKDTSSTYFFNEICSKFEVDKVILIPFFSNFKQSFDKFLAQKKDIYVFEELNIAQKKQTPVNQWLYLCVYFVSWNHCCTTTIKLRVNNVNNQFHRR